MKKQELSPFNYYYKELFSHYNVTPQNKNAKKVLIRASIIVVLFLVLYILLNIFKNSSFVHYFTNGSPIMHSLYSVMILYAFIAFGSYTIYHIVSYNFEIIHKHELLKKDIKGAYNLFSLLYKFIHLPWILVVCFTLKILSIFKIQDLRKYLPMLIGGYLYFLMISLVVLQVLCNWLDKLLTDGILPHNNLITEVTYLYIIVLVTIIFSKHIPTGLLKIVIRPFVNKNSLEYRRIFRQYHLLNYYFLVVITLVLKALNFTGIEKILIDALFYTTNALSLLSTAREKANNSL